MTHALISVADKRRVEIAAIDPAIRARLVADPRRGIEGILGRALPSGTSVRLHDEPYDAMYFALPLPEATNDIPEPTTRRQFFENVLFDAAARNPDLRRQAMADPRALFLSITNNDLDLPPGLQPVIFTDAPSEIHIVLPQPSEAIDDELPDDLLEYVAGGAPSPCNSKAGENKSSVSAGADKLSL